MRLRKVGGVFQDVTLGRTGGWKLAPGASAYSLLTKVYTVATATSTMKHCGERHRNDVRIANGKGVLLKTQVSNEESPLSK